MKNRYKIFFWISIFVLLVTNLYNFHNNINNAVDRNYYQVTCEEWRNDNNQLKKLLPLDSDYSIMIKLIKNKGLEIDEFEKGENKVIQFHSFDLLYGSNGKMLEINER